MANLHTNDNNLTVNTTFNGRQTQQKLANQKSRLVFLLKCRRHNVFPNFILRNTSKFESKSQCASAKNIMHNAIVEFNRKLLNAEISDCCYRVKMLSNNISNNSSSNNDSTSTAEENYYQNSLSINNNRLHRKFNELIKKQKQLDDIKYDESLIKNFSGIEVPHKMLVLLGLGPKFALPHLEIPTLDLIADIELIVSRFAAEPIKKAMRAHLTFLITSWMKKKKRLKRIERFLISATKTTAKFLKDNGDIFISNSDKGNVTIIANRLDYDRKMNELINNTDDFEEIVGDPTESLQNKNNRLITTLHNKTRQFITQQEASSLRTYIAVPPSIFGQFKFHKEGMPIRPIISTINSACYKLSRYLASLLKRSFQSKYSLKNSKQFVKFITKTHIFPGYELVSFDVSNCFNNISTKLALTTVEQYFDERLKPNTEIPEKRIHEFT